MSEFSTHLKFAMDKAQKNAADLSRACGISEGTISRYLSGQVEPRMSTVYILASSLNTTVDYLSGNTENFEIRAGESDLLTVYRALSLTGKEKVLDFAGYLLDTERREDSSHV